MANNSSEIVQTDWSRLAWPRLCGLLAEKPTRLSAAMHNAGFKAKDLPFTYVAFQLLDTKFGLQVMQSMGLRAYSLTIPHKEVALPHLDFFSADAKEIGAVNTVINSGKALFGFNTDWYGVRTALSESGFAPAGKQALVFGAGGASRAAIYALKNLGLSRIVLANRSDDRAKQVAKEFEIDFIPYASLNSELLSSFDLFLNSTPIGSPLSGPHAVFPFSLTCFSKGQTVFDMVTSETELTTVARARGATIVLGLRMLLHQGLKQFELFTEGEAPREAMEQALEKAV